MGRITGLFLTLLVLALPAQAHHSFAIYDFEKQIEFDGVVETLKFRNPHMAMTLKTVDENGNEKIIEFVEGAPANMLVRSGLKPAMIKTGTHIVAVGSPMYEDKDKFFLRKIRLDNGEEF
jgi:hypothetical protein